MRYKTEIGVMIIISLKEEEENDDDDEPVEILMLF